MTNASKLRRWPKELKEIMNICEASKDKHLLWFSKLIKEHFNGMVARAKFRISNGMMEGINNKIKAQSLFLCDASFLTYSLLLASMILRKKYSSSG